MLEFCFRRSGVGVGFFERECASAGGFLFKLGLRQFFLSSAGFCLSCGDVGVAGVCPGRYELLLTVLFCPGLGGFARGE